MTWQSVTHFEPLIRLSAFLAVFGAVALWEVLAPRRRLALRRLKRWPHNLGLLAVDIITVRLLAPGAAIAVAVVGEARGWGLLNALPLPLWAAALIAVMLLDLVVYFQHVMFMRCRRSGGSTAYTMLISIST